MARPGGIGTHFAPDPVQQEGLARLDRDLRVVWYRGLPQWAGAKSLVAGDDVILLREAVQFWAPNLPTVDHFAAPGPDAQVMLMELAP